MSLLMLQATNLENFMLLSPDSFLPGYIPWAWNTDWFRNSAAALGNLWVDEERQLREKKKKSKD